MTPEKKFEQKVIEAFREKGWFCRHFDVVGQDGFPDLIAFKGTRFVMVELKAGSKLRPEQKALRTLLERGHGITISVLEERNHIVVITHPGLPFPCVSIAQAIDMLVKAMAND